MKGYCAPKTKAEAESPEHAAYMVGFRRGWSAGAIDFADQTRGWQPTIAQVLGAWRKHLEILDSIDTVREDRIGTASLGEPDLWMQEDETLAKLPCGCTVIRNYGGSGDPAMWLCTAHRNSPPKPAAKKKTKPKKKGQKRWKKTRTKR
jgi:hypothetical protein